NDKPVINYTGANPTSMQEHTPVVFSMANGNAITLTDVDFAETGSTGVETMELTVPQGKLTLGSTAAGLTYLNGNGTGDINISGSLTDLNAALSGLTYTATANPSASVVLNVIANDGGNVGASGGTQSAVPLNVTINITAQNDAPVNLLNGTALSASGTH